ncbi:hypothetical protein BC830DRAFT_1067969 [Chytriomyces sp. MP71]|nr:hypothetical protein BC830DRAFT_1067969 [Chytriomyces sp. MP71]
MDIKWSRDESLAHIVDIEFFELPDAHLFSLDHDELDEPLAQTEKLNPLARYTRRWNTHLTHLQSYLPTLPARLASRVLGFLNPSSTPVANAANASIPLHTDRWGYRKLFVAGTRSGKVHAIETASGTTVWTRFLPRGSLVRDVEVVRAGAVKFPPVVGLFGQDAVTGSHFVHRLNALTGRDFEGEGAGLGAVERWEDGEHLIQLPVREGRESLRVFAVVTSKSTIELVPNTDEARAAFESILDHFFFYRVKHGDRGVVGYMGLKDEAKGVYLARKVWKLDLPEGEVVADFAERDRTEPISSMGKILGNRSVLYKYLNPNLLALATLRETTTTSTVYLYLLDTVTGTLLHRAEYLGAGNAGEGLHSIHLVQLDNAVVLSFYNHGPAATEAGAAAAAAAAAAVEGAAFVDEEANVAGAEPGAGKRRRNKKKAAALAGVKTAPNVKGYEVVVLETYEMPKPDLRVESDTYSSFNMKKPSILSQSYMFPNQITAMGFTRTGAGIASREILVGLSSNQVYGINKRLLDPRRPLGAPSADDREEQLFPYAPVLHFNPYDVASHELPVLGVTRIQSTGTLLESTSIVAAYGLDLFVARRAPSRTFDVLSEDFGYGWLILTMVSLVVGIQVAKYYVSSIPYSFFYFFWRGVLWCVLTALLYRRSGRG